MVFSRYVNINSKTNTPRPTVKSARGIMSPLEGKMKGSLRG